MNVWLAILLKRRAYMVLTSLTEALDSDLSVMAQVFQGSDNSPADARQSGTAGRYEQL